MFNVYVWIAVAIAVIGFGGYEHHAGYQQRVDEDQAEITRLNTEARAKEAEYDKKLVVANNALKKAKDDVQTKKFNLNADAESGKLRLPQASCGLSANTGSTPGAGNTANESESERQTIKELIGIATDGDTAILSLNSCIKQYNEVRELVNKGVK